MWATKQWETQRTEKKKNAEMHSGEMFGLSTGREDGGHFYSQNILQHLIHCMTGTNAGLTIRKDKRVFPL